MHLGKQDMLFLGNLSAKRDWGHAKDFVKGMWQIVQQDKPDDFVLATNAAYSVRRFCEQVFAQLGTEIEWEGEGINEKGLDAKSGKILIKVDPAYFRPTEVDILHGDASKAKEILGWKPEYDIDMLVKEMVESDLSLAKKE